MMNNIGTLYTYELKKIANRKLVWIVGMIMIALSMFLSVSDLVTSSSYYGETSVSAYQAMKVNKDNAEKFSGMAINDTLLREMQEDCANESKDHTKSQAVTSNNQIAIDIGVGSDDTESSVLKKYFPIYSYVQQITDDDSLTLSINSNELYAMRKKLISDNRADQMLNEDEYNDWNSKEIQISEPFIYEYTDGWSNVWAYAYTINYMLLLLLAISLSNVFSIEYYRKTDAIILCSQYGKKQLFISKILAGMTFSIASAIILFAATLFSSLLVYGTDGFHAALQLAFPLSSLNISVGGSVLVLLVNLIVISMVYGSLIMLLSAILKSNVAVMAIPVGIMILTMMVDIPYQFRLASQVYDLLPTNILNKTELWDDRLICIWGKYFTNFQIAPFLYVVFAVLLVIIGMAIYQRHQVQAR